MNLKSIIQFFLDNKEWLPIAIALLTIIVTITLWVLGQVISLIYFIIQLKLDEDRYRAYTELEGRKKQSIDLIKHESLFFDEPNHKRFLFIKGMKFSKNGKKVRKRRLLKKSYIIYGNAGDGKSAFLKYDYLKSANNILTARKTLYLYLTSSDMVEYLENREYFTELLNDISFAKYKKLFLYIDGIDEIGEDWITDFNELLREFKMACQGKVIIKVTCRNEFYKKHLERNNTLSFIDNNINVHEWTTKEILKFAKYILLILKFSKYESSNPINQIYGSISQEKKWAEYITSPLLMKLYIYCKLHTAVDIEEKIKNKYDLYESFVTEIIKAYLRRNNSPQNNSNLITLQDDISKEIFEMYKRKKKSIPLNDNYNCISTVLKKLPNNNYTFTHETFYEYFIARNYMLNIFNNISCIDVHIFSVSYSNDYADFITDAINRLNEKSKTYISERFMELYSFSMNKDVQKEYNSYFGEPKVKINLEMLSEKEKFSFKYELIFRLGRLYISNKRIKQFLKLVYTKDKNIYLKEDTEYFIAVLKRCCAISSSFIGDEEIEIDYVSQMLPEFNKEYNRYYDLANRSHTLLFYGDVNGDIYNFRDDDITICYERAFGKRIKRLQIDLPDIIDKMDPKQKKKYYFRLFDLATIYTFLYNRKKPMSENEMYIVQNCKVNFVGASENRVSLMKEIRDSILSFNNYLNMKQ